MSKQEQEWEAWKVAYLARSEEERVKYWSGTLHRQMRWNVESGVDPYEVFSKEWIEDIRKIEPRIEFLIKKVVQTYWRGYWDEAKILAAFDTEPY